jgi:hypothetical protein
MRRKPRLQRAILSDRAIRRNGLRQRQNVPRRLAAMPGESSPATIPCVRRRPFGAFAGNQQQKIPQELFRTRIPAAKPAACLASARTARSAHQPFAANIAATAPSRASVRAKKIRVKPLIYFPSCLGNRRITGRNRRIGDDHRHWPLLGRAGWTRVRYISSCYVSRKGQAHPAVPLVCCPFYKRLSASRDRYCLVLPKEHAACALHNQRARLPA